MVAFAFFVRLTTTKYDVKNLLKNKLIRLCLYFGLFARHSHQRISGYMLAAVTFAAVAKKVI
jgi:hypothetical protein